MNVFGVFYVWKQGRDDDNLETIRKRFKLFNEQTLPVIKHYESIAAVQKVNLQNLNIWYTFGFPQLLNLYCWQAPVKRKLLSNGQTLVFLIPTSITFFLRNFGDLRDPCVQIPDRQNELWSWLISSAFATRNWQLIIILVLQINGMQSVEDVFAEIRPLFNPILQVQQQLFNPLEIFI